MNLPYCMIGMNIGAAPFGLYGAITGIWNHSVPQALQGASFTVICIAFIFFWIRKARK